MSKRGGKWISPTPPESPQESASDFACHESDQGEERGKEEKEGAKY
jgi:hypothetical protein